MKYRAARNIILALVGVAVVLLAALFCLEQPSGPDQVDTGIGDPEPNSVLVPSDAGERHPDPDDQVVRATIDRAVSPDVSDPSIQHVRLVSASGLVITKAYVRHENHLTSVPVRDSLLACDQLSQFAAATDLLVVPGHKPKALRDILGRPTAELEPDVWLEVRHEPSQIRDVTFGHPDQEWGEYFRKALWGDVDETTWAFTLCLEGFPGPVRKLPELEDVCTLHLADGSAVLVSVWLDHGQKALLDLSTLTPAASIAPLRVLVERSSPEIGSVDLKLITRQADEPDPESLLVDWGRLRLCCSHVQRVTLERGESEVVLGMYIGGRGTLRAEGRSSGVAWVGGIEGFVHDGSTQIVRLTHTHVVKGRLVDEDRRAMEGTVQWKWREKERREPFNICRESKTDELAISEGHFAVPLVPPWSQSIPMSEVEITFKAFGFEDKKVTVNCGAGSESILGNVEMSPARGPVVHLILESDEQRRKIVSSRSTGIALTLLRRKQVFNLRAKNVLETLGEPLSIVLGDSLHSASPQEFGSVMPGDTAIIVLVGKYEEGRADAQLFSIANISGDLVVVPRRVRNIKIVGGVASGEKPVILEWRWPTPDSIFGFEFSEITSDAWGVMREELVELPRDDVWLVWRRGETMLGRVDLSCVSGPLRIP